MRFAFVLPNASGGGAEKAVLNLGDTLARRGHRVDLMLLEQLVDHVIPGGVTLHALVAPGRRLSRGILGKWRAARHLRRRLAELGQRQPFDLVVSTLPFADEIALRARLPRHWCRIANTLSAEIAALEARLPAKADRRLRRYRRMYEGGSLIAVSDGVATDLRDRLRLVRARIVRIYNPFDFASIRAAAGEAASDRPTEPYILHVGRFNAQKRHDLLLDAFARLDAAPRLVLLTQPDPGLQRLIEARSLADRVTVAGFRKNPYPWIAGASLLVLCSDHEGLPNVVIEALALGRPVVSTDCPSGPREILGAACPDCLVPVNDAESLARAMRRALDSPPDPARVDLTRFSAETAAAAYERLAAERG
jgi:glycosyltransferase involved in cell wall biosynthesis